MANIKIDPEPRHKLSPLLYMQFMEPLGTTDASVDAGWDFVHQQWRPSLIDIVRDLSPGAIRWGGILTSYWKWQEGVGPRESRKPMINYLWGGLESNQIGVHEILDLCQQVNAEPILAVNFAADGRPEYLKTGRGENRAGTPEEAAALVSYCNDPEHRERRQNGTPKPWAIRLWQLGNETSYPPEGRRFTSEENAQTFLAFARAMRERDSSIKLIGWGDRDREDQPGKWWAEDLLDIAGDEVDYVAVHMMRQVPQRQDTLLTGTRYRQDYARAWNELLEIFSTVEQKLLQLKEVLQTRRSNAKIAITEGHLSLKPHNKIPLLHEWISGLYHAKMMNLYERHSDAVEIATLADFFGNSWAVNAVMIPSPNARPYLMPVGRIMQLYRHHSGDYAVQVDSTASNLDLTASRRANRLYLHAVNTDLSEAQEVTISVPGEKVAKGKMFTIAPGSVETYVSQDDADVFSPIEHDLEGGENLHLKFPAASVVAVELELLATE